MLNVKPEPFGIYVGPFFSHQIFADLSCFFFSSGWTGGRNWVMNYKKSSRDFQNTGFGQLREDGACCGFEWPSGAVADGVSFGSRLGIGNTLKGPHPNSQ